MSISTSITPPEGPAPAGSLEGGERGSRRDVFLSLQYLRGGAALLVMGFHLLGNRMAAALGGSGDLGMWGVDIFFAISGFILWRSTRGRTSAGQFLLGRAFRIYPMYWIALTLWVGIRFVIPDQLRNADVTPDSLLYSYLLIPHFHKVYHDAVWPILTVGWTLQLEVFFYALFAAALWITPNARRATALLGVLVALAAIGLCTAQTQPVMLTLTNPLLLEFAGGVLLGIGVDRLRAAKVGTALGSILLGTAGAFLFCRFGTLYNWRPLALGVPALLVVAGSLALEDRLRLRPLAWWRRLGDASYSLYLTHPLSISAASVIWHRLRLPEDRQTAAAFVLATGLAAIAIGLLCHRFVEAPLLARFGARRRRRVATGAPVPAFPAIAR